MKIKFLCLPLLFNFLAVGLSAQLICATPGKDGSTTNLSGQVNTYFAGSTASLSSGATSVVIGASKGNSTGITAGDLILIVQMQGADINSANTGNYGSGSGTGGSGYLTTGSHFLAGKFEFVTATNSVSTSGGTLSFSPALANSYEIRAYSAGSNGRSVYQVVRVPQYDNVTLSGSVTANKWDGSVGGIIAMDVSGNLNFNGEVIDASASGFRGGGGRNFKGGTGANTDFRTLSTIANNGQKGEGIAGTPAFVWNGISGTANLINTGSEGYPDGSSSRGAPGNAGGGAQDSNPADNNQNSGGGGGGNGGAGGGGGNSWTANAAVGGRGGSAFAQAGFARLVMGGGGGAGNGNNSADHPDALSGGPGGGMVILKAGSVSGTGTINANGQNAPNVNPNSGDDGAGAGGAGGSVLFTAKTTSGMSGITVTANGGKGGNTKGGATDHGPGGGGGGGVIFSNGTLNASSKVSGGANGTTNGDVYGASAGSSGVLSQDAANDPSTAYAGYRCLALPISRFVLSGTVKNNEIRLQWITFNEINTDHFEVERSFDGMNFVNTGLSSAAAGNSNTEKTYSVNDNLSPADAASANVYYRIKAVDADGNMSYSNIISLELTSTTGVTAWPNPFTNKITINLSDSRTNRSLLIKLRDISGRIFWQKEEIVPAGSRSIIITSLDKLTGGIYLLTIADRLSGKRTEIKLIKK